MRKFFKILKYIFFSISAIVIIILTGLNIYYSVLLKSIENREYPDPSTLSPLKVEDELINYKINLIPYPKKVELIPGLFRFPSNISFQAPDDIRDRVKSLIDRFFGVNSVHRYAGMIRFNYNNEIKDQGYYLSLRSNSVDIQYKDIQGAYYALVTLKQLNTGYSGIIPNIRIEDHPDLPVRGAMLDISRDKVPKLETIEGIIDMLADLKYNHLELYIEGFSFAYPSFESLWRERETPVNGVEIRVLDAYCQERFIDLVPNQNSLGHMTAWLETEEFAKLAECPDGLNLMPLVKMRSTLDPYDPRSIQLIEKMMNDMLPNFSSDYFNANLDEPFELGRCKSKDKAEEIGIGIVYLDYAKKVNKLTEKHGKKMMMWGDVVIKHPEIISSIPDDIIVLDWGYEAEYPFQKNGPRFKETGLEFMVCPGTSSWMSIGGRTDNMIGNISNAVKSGLKHGAAGMLLTDWGDMGHWQYLPVSYAGFVLGGGLSWNSASYNESALEDYLDIYIYRDQNKNMGSFTLDLGRYNQFEEILAPGMTLTNLGFQLGFMDKVLYEIILGIFQDTFEEFLPEEMTSIIRDRFTLRHNYQYQELLNYLQTLENDLAKTDMKTADAELVKAEYYNAIAMIRAGAGLKNFIDQELSMSRNEKIEYLVNLKKEYAAFMKDRQELWLSRNKSGGLDRSMAALLKLDKDIDDQIELLNKSILARGWDRLKVRTIAASAAMVL